MADFFNRIGRLLSRRVANGPKPPFKDAVNDQSGSECLLRLNSVLDGAEMSSIPDLAEDQAIDAFDAYQPVL